MCEVKKCATTYWFVFSFPVGLCLHRASQHFFLVTFNWLIILQNGHFWFPEMIRVSGRMARDQQAWAVTNLNIICVSRSFGLYLD